MPDATGGVFAQHTDMTIAGGPVRVYRSGDHGPAVLLLHGGALDTAEGVWRSVAPTLARDYRVYAIDLPRHGASRPWRGNLDTDFFDTLIAELLDALNLPRVAIVGLSLGGGIGIGFALNHPDRVSALVVIGPGGIGAKRRFHFFTWLVVHTPGLMRLSAKYYARSPKRLRKSLADSLTAGADTPGFDAIVASAIEEAKAKSRHGERVLDDWMINAVGPFRMRLDYTPEVSRLRVPSLWLRGERDSLVSHADLAAAASAAPGSELATIPGAGHIATYDRPDEVSRLVGDFLSRTVEN
ncbi:alpha/beta hydrolase [Mycolicibacterium agri]|uniref:Alpha/beta hydrolase n=1 Tax=Mycolicibacterium agri TaxID=36811 RepID=A0A2A7NEW4_MYCAG|nr:alpha/beta hydrolase [Mycolicibacterium agri]PEG42257.1 alpha/beta hydrolase [Mycolicibacterium agri]GFG51102.1 alpha/beta hydrolase [Mycolicibacterium agri]